MAERKSTWPTRLINQGVAGAVLSGLACLIEVNLLIPPLTAGTFTPTQWTSAWAIIYITSAAIGAFLVWYVPRAIRYIRTGEH